MDLMLKILLGNAFQLETGHYKETKQTKKWTVFFSQLLRAQNMVLVIEGKII